MTIKIGILYSYAPHFVRTVRQVRQAYPDSRITALVPETFPTELIAQWTDAIQPLAPAASQRSSLRHALRLLAHLRRSRYDLLVVLFNSPRLQGIASLSRAHQCAYYTLDGSQRPVELRLIRHLVSTVARLIHGHLTYYKIWWHIHTHPIDTGSGKPQGPTQDASSS